jgi:bifunctional polynucleotide phosphatase/kinase
LNLNLSFYTPEEHFLNEKDRGKVWVKPAFNPTTISEENMITLVQPSDTKITSDSQEIILLVGFPGSGKSFFCKKYLKSAGYEIINRDTLNTQQKCLAVLDVALKRGKSCVIDSTNPDPTSRKRYIDEANKLSIPIRCFHVTTSYEQSRHNNKFRELTDTSHTKINDMIFHVYKNKFVEPTIKEGFTEIIKVNFVPKFDKQDHEKLYKMYLLER